MAMFNHIINKSSYYLDFVFDKIYNPLYLNPHVGGPKTIWIAFHNPLILRVKLGWIDLIQLKPNSISELVWASILIFQLSLS